MTDATQATTSSRSSMLYALGKLEAVVAGQADTIKELPVRILEVIMPQLLPIKDHETRIRALERQRWILVGIVSLGGTLVGLYEKSGHH